MSKIIAYDIKNYISVNVIFIPFIKEKGDFSKERSSFLNGDEENGNHACIDRY